MPRARRVLGRRPRRAIPRERPARDHDGADALGGRGLLQGRACRRGGARCEDWASHELRADRGAGGLARADRHRRGRGVPPRRRRGRAARGRSAPGRRRGAALRRRADLAGPPAPGGRRRAEPPRAACRQAGRRGGGGARPCQARAARGDRQVGGRWRFLTSFYASPGFTDERIHAFLATDLSDDPAEAEEEERIEVVSEPVSRIDEVIRSCEDSKSLVTLLWFRAFVLPTFKGGGAGENRCPWRRRTVKPERRTGRRGTHDDAAFEHLVLDFLAYLELERGLSRNTLQSYRTDLLQFGAFLRQRGLDAQHAESRDVSDFLTGLAGPEGPPSRRRRSSGRRPAFARSTGTSAVRESAPTIPRGAVGAAAQQSAAPRARSVGGAGLLSQPQGTEPIPLRDRAMLELMYASGLRASETIDLELSDVDLDEGLCGRGERARRSG